MTSDDTPPSDLQVIKHTLLVILAVLMIATGFMIMPDYKWEEFREKSGFVFVIVGLIVLIAPVLRLWAISAKQLLNFADEVEKEHHQGQKKSTGE